MAMTINTNIAALNAQRNLGKTQNMLNKSLQRLSSGLRINSAKDDAAGLAIANRMTSQVRGLNQAVRNANDGISLAQTAEGALQESGNILQRIRELAVQASSDGSTDSDRASMQIEVAQLIAEMDRIAASTSFNGQKLLDGTFSTATFQVGADKGQSISMGLSSARTNALGASGGVATGDYTMAKDTTSAGSLVTSGSMATLGAGELSINGTEIRAALSGDDTVSTSDNAGSSIAIAAAINASASTTGVTAYAEKTSLALGAFTTGAEDLAAGDFQINGVDITSGAVDITTADLLVQYVNLFSDDTGVTASNNAGDITLTAIDGRNIQVTSGGTLGTLTFANFDTTAADDDVARGTVSLYSNETFTVGGTAPEKFGFSEGSVALDETHWLDTGTDFEMLALGDLVINGYNVIKPTAAGDQDGDTQSNASDVVEEASAKAIAYAINNTDGLKNEVTATAKTVANLGTITAYDANADNFTIIINDKSITFNQKIEANDASGYLVGAMNASFAAATANADDDYGLVASLNSDNELIITSSTGVTIDVEVAGGGESGSQFLSAVDTSAAIHVAHKGTVSLSAKTGYTVGSIEGGKKALAGIETSVGSIANVSVATYEGAQNALTAVDGALTQIDDMRAELGAIQNRFDSTVANLENVSENLSAARSRILDADFAAETAAMTKAQIMQQAGTAMLAQANQLPQLVLQLLQ